MKTIKRNSDEIFNKKIKAEKSIYEILHSGEYGGLITEEEGNYILFNPLGSEDLLY